MFCFQCQETAKNSGCTVKGMCGKPEETANLQDLLIFVLRGMAVYGERLGELGQPDRSNDDFVLQALFATITNANWDDARFMALIQDGLARREKLKDAFLSAYKAKHGKDFADPLPEAATWSAPASAFAEKAKSVGILATENEDVRSLRELLIIGLKGIAAYAEHAAVLGFRKAEIDDFMLEALASTTKNLSVDEMVGLVMRAGNVAVTTMALLDEANTTTYGNPEITEVNIGVGTNPGILISGHDLKDMEELLKQTEGTGVDVYTHGEMLPANYYPAFKKYSHFVGNYGGSWWQQNPEFESFNGPILLTTNCLVPLKKDNTYLGRLYTTGMVGYEGATHIPDRPAGGAKDFSAMIAQAKKCPPPTELETGSIVGGFAHHQVWPWPTRWSRRSRAAPSSASWSWPAAMVARSPAPTTPKWPSPAQGHRHPHRGLRQVPLQQARPGRYRRHPARAGRRAVQRLLLPGRHRPEAQRGLWPR
jgi:hydroxylamine reductase